MKRISIAPDDRAASRQSSSKAYNYHDMLNSKSSIEIRQDEEPGKSSPIKEKRGVCEGCIEFILEKLKKYHQENSNVYDEIVIETGGDESDIAFHQMFEVLDQDSNGSIDHSELKKMTRSLGLPHKGKDLRRMFNRMDRDCDGVITINDFKHDFLSRWETPEERTHLLINLFKIFDMTGDGNIQPKEVKIAMMSIGEKVSNQEIDEMFRQFSKEPNSSNISLEVFLKAMESHIDSVLPKKDLAHSTDRDHVV